MSVKEALKPKIGISKKDEKRKAKKEKLQQELVAKDEAQKEAIREQEEQEERERAESSIQPEAEATMGAKFAELLDQISNQQDKNSAPQKRTQKKTKRDAIANSRAILKSAAFQMDPVSTISVVNSRIQSKL